MANTRPAVKPPETEIGSSSSDQFVALANSWVAWAASTDLERVPELQWPNSTKTYPSMMNDAQIQSLMYGLCLPIRAYRWYLEPNNAAASSIDRISADYNLPVGKDGEFFRRRGQRRFSFDKHLEDALRALQYGHYPFEQVGEIDSDLTWHLRKLGVRPPRSITEINLDPNDGNLANIVQGYLTNGTKRTIPIERLVWYSWDREGSNWVGRSMLRCVYRNHVVKDRVLRVGAINIERAGGVPFVQAQEGASADQIRELDALARRFRVGEGAGAALPHGAQLKFASAANGDGAVAYIKQQNEEMARAFLQMVSMLGTTNSGSRALGDTFHEILKIAQFTIAKWFADQFNEYVIEDDVEWNEGPTQEYAPLLQFDAGMQDPMTGFNEVLNDPQNGLQVSDPQTLAMLGRGEARPTTPHRTGMRRAMANGRVSAAGVASPIPLPPRPLRRNPYQHEIEAAVDFASIDSAFDMALMSLEHEVRMARSFQADELRDAVVAANGNVRTLASINTSVSAADRIETHLYMVAALAADQAVQEASRQGVTIPRQPVDDIQKTIRARAEAIDSLLRQDIEQSARRESLRLTGGGLSSAEVADETRQFLSSLTGSTMMDLLGGAVQSSMNEGRKLVFQRDGEDGTLYASEILDTNTCSPCVGNDGTPYDSLEEAERAYPTGHFKDCKGRERCRGTILKVYAKARETSPNLSVTS